MSRYLFIILLHFLMIPIAQAQHKKAFLVGISHYDNARTNYEWNDIHGVEDVKLISPLLKQQGFATTELLDGNATYHNIKLGLQRFIKSCNKGDIVYIHFSTHGQPFEDKNGDEADNWDEALIPIDAHKNYKKGKYMGECHLIDDELNLYVDKLRKKIGEKGCIYIIIDACHAGTSSRGDEGTRGTMVGFTQNLQKRYNPPIEHKNNYALKNAKDLCPIIYIEACRSDQINRELKTKEGIYGALSYNVAQALKQIKLSSDRNTFVNAVKQSARIKGNWPNNQNMVIETSR